MVRFQGKVFLMLFAFAFSKLPFTQEVHRKCLWEVDQSEFLVTHQYLWHY